MMAFRERDVRNDIHDRLIATHAFTDVYISGLPEDSGSAASDLCAAAIEPVGGSLTSGWDAQTDGGLYYGASVNVTLMARNDDVQVRDETAEMLLGYLHNAVNGQSLAGITVPGRTLVTSWSWQKAMPPERRIMATVGYWFIVDGWDEFDVAE